VAGYEARVPGHSPETAVIGLGANLGDRVATLAAAAARLGALGVEVARSPLYETAPLGPPQPEYLNAVILLETAFSPEALLQGVLSIEAALGRVRRERWGPRTIDLDVLALGDQVVRTPRITLPHPEIARRAFVLRPWADVAPMMRIPGLGTVAELLAQLPEAERAGVRLFTSRW
jgi:2-amino-4-hydroxy-6-hydroxymethyldihydropteridine diphosphokinase